MRVSLQKEKDIELTARIGKDLLTYNTKLESDVASLQAELKSANEKITQLTHELHKKTELIQVLTNDMDETGSESGKHFVTIIIITQYIIHLLR